MQYKIVQIKKNYKLQKYEFIRYVTKSISIKNTDHIAKRKNETIIFSSTSFSIYCTLTIVSYRIKENNI